MPYVISQRRHQRLGQHVVTHQKTDIPYYFSSKPKAFKKTGSCFDPQLGMVIKGPAHRLLCFMFTRIVQEERKG